MTARGGYTTGPFAAAAAKAALAALCGAPASDWVEVSLPDGERVRCPVISSKCNRLGGEAVVRRFAGKDPNVRCRRRVAAEVRFIEGDEVVFAAGEGVGVVTKSGLAMRLGEPAISAGPRQMIRQAVREITARGVHVTISIPGGRELARRTLNPRLGIEGGLCVLGTTGRVGPFSALELREGLKCALDVAHANGIVAPVLVSGDTGERAARRHFSFRPEQIVQVSNQWGYMLDRTVEHRFDRCLVVGHPGKLVKLVSGEWDACSKSSSSDVPLVAQVVSSFAGAPVPESPTVEDMFQKFAPSQRKQLANLLAGKIRDVIHQRTGGQLEATVALITQDGELLGSAGDLTPWCSDGNSKNEVGAALMGPKHSPQWGPAVVAFDLESVLVPEIWETVARVTAVSGLALTTRDIADYDVLMRERMRLCRENRLTLSRLREIVAAMEPLPGAVELLASVQKHRLAVIVSDTYHELAGPVVEKLGCPLMVCNGLTVDDQGYINGYRPHHLRGKAGAVAHFQRLGFQVVAVGDSFNDLSMLQAADNGILFRPCSGLRKSAVGLPVVWSLPELRTELHKSLTKMA